MPDSQAPENDRSLTLTDAAIRELIGPYASAYFALRRHLNREASLILAAHGLGLSTVAREEAREQVAS